MFLPVGLGPLALVFMLGGVQIAIEETLEDAFCREKKYSQPRQQRRKIITEHDEISRI